MRTNITGAQMSPKIRRGQVTEMRRSDGPLRRWQAKQLFGADHATNLWERDRIGARLRADRCVPVAHRRSCTITDRDGRSSTQWCGPERGRVRLTRTSVGSSYTFMNSLLSRVMTDGVLW